jgi:hypothetical protein
VYSEGHHGPRSPTKVWARLSIHFRQAGFFKNQKGPVGPSKKTFFRSPSKKFVSLPHLEFFYFFTKIKNIYPISHLNEVKKMEVI